MKRYEYEIVKITSDEKKTMLEKGKLGWRLAAVENNIFYFIRELGGE